MPIIFNKGSLPKDSELEDLFLRKMLTCHHCESRFVMSRGDAYTVGIREKGSGKIVCFDFHCPVCGGWCREWTP